jgi:hypothetical protein
MTAETFVSRLRYESRGILARYPKIYLSAVLFLLHMNWRQGVHPAARDTEIVICGFPRSGNTFAVTAFRLAQKREVKIAHHLHASAQVIYGAKRKIPCIVLVRDPVDAVISFIIRHPQITAKQALREYKRFYSHIFRFHNWFITALFEEVTRDFGRIIEKTNAKYSTCFEPFCHTEENVRECFRLIEEGNKRNFAAQRIIESKVARPSAERLLLKEEMRHRLFGKKERFALREAHKIFNIYKTLA